MLVVTDKGVKIQLASSPNSLPNLNAILITAGLLALLGIAIAIGLAIEIAVGLAILIIVGGFAWQKFGQKSATNKIISGGEVLITPYQIEHISSLGQKSVYPLPQQIQFNQSKSQLIICDKSHQPLLIISGFPQPQHTNIAQAVLQGKSIQTHGNPEANRYSNQNRNQ